MISPLPAVQINTSADVHGRTDDMGTCQPLLTPVHCALMADTVDYLRWLIDGKLPLPGLDVDSQDELGRTPLMYACSVGTYT
jgi:ankyrin repeat protein